MRTPVVPAPQSLSDLTPLGACPQSVLPVPWSVQPSHLPFHCAWPLNTKKSNINHRRVSAGMRPLTVTLAKLLPAAG